MTHTLIHISPQDSPETPIESTLFYKWLQATTSRQQPNLKLEVTVKLYLGMDMDKHRLTKQDAVRLRDIFESFWYSHYDGLDSQEYIL